MSNQFVYAKGPYTEFRGYVFAYGKPTTVADRATVDALSIHPDFKRYDPPAQPMPAVVRRPILRVKARGAI